MPRIGSGIHGLDRNIEDGLPDPMILFLVKENTDKTARSVDNNMADGVVTPCIRPLGNRPTGYRKVMRITRLRGTEHTRRLLQVDKDREGMSVDQLEQDIIGSIP